VELQRLTWGADFNEVVPATILKISSMVGGVTAGAFDQEGRLLGFVFGMTGVERGELVHWSHMLAVVEEARNLGLGRRLKELQRDLLAQRGVQRIYWTFDPLVGRNAHLNLNRLGARVREYVPDMYPGTGSKLHNFGTDRFVVMWPVASGAPVERPGAGRRAYAPAELLPLLAQAPIVNTRGEGEPVEEVAEETSPRVRVEVPADLEPLLHSRGDTVLRWRYSTRAAFLWYLGRGYTVSGYFCDRLPGRCYYVLSAPADC
jgi:predicted GNAT superfamily acetyltransferase